MILAFNFTMITIDKNMENVIESLIQYMIGLLYDLVIGESFIN
jgi:hypothetical protein